MLKMREKNKNSASAVQTVITRLCPKKLASKKPGEKKNRSMNS